MKKSAIALVALFATVSAHAQLGIVGGLTSTATNLNDAYTDIAKSQSVNQYHVGLVYNLNLPFGFSVQPGLVYNMKGASLSTNLSGISGLESMKDLNVQVDTKTGFLEVPVRVAWGMDFGIVKPFIFAEPFVGYAITTETKSKFKDDATKELVSKIPGIRLDTSNSDEDKWVNRDRFSYGLGLGAGVILVKHIGLTVKYYWDFGTPFTTTEDGSAKTSISAAAIGKAMKDQKCSGIVASLYLYF